MCTFNRLAALLLALAIAAPAAFAQAWPQRTVRGAANKNIADVYASSWR